jgi:RNA polymerase sigma-54 factor
MDVRLSMQHKLSQSLVMTPQLQMAIKLLALSRLELIDQVRAELMENPILEDQADGPEGERRAAEVAETPSIDQLAALEARSEALPTSHEDRAAMEATKQEDYWDKFLEAYSNQSPLPTQGRLNNEELPSLEATLTRRSTLSDHLEWQILLSNFNEAERNFAVLVARNLDDNGYLTLKAVTRDSMTPAALEAEAKELAAAAALVAAGGEPEPGLSLTIEDLARECDLDPEDAEEVLKIIQTLDPIGVASRDLRECLLVQAEHFGYGEDDLVWQVIDKHLHHVEKRNFGAIARELHCELTDVYEASRVIQHFEPRPGRNFATEDAQYITPDVYVHKVGDDYVVSTNDDGLPKLKINEMQARSLMKDPKAKQFVQDKLTSARWFLRSIDQRQKTIVKVTQSIVEKQRDFFEKGIEYLKPMILRDVAEAVGMHESTISRVTTNKYVHTPRGIFELKYFFNSSISVEGGTEIASEAVKQAIKKIISEEDVRNPLSDEQIVKRLEGQKVLIARRTVAKYREELGILPSNLRRDYA